MDYLQTVNGVVVCVHACMSMPELFTVLARIQFISLFIWREEVFLEKSLKKGMREGQKKMETRDLSHFSIARLKCHDQESTHRRYDVPSGTEA